MFLFNVCRYDYILCEWDTCFVGGPHQVSLAGWSRCYKNVSFWNDNHRYGCINRNCRPHVSKSLSYLVTTVHDLLWNRAPYHHKWQPDWISEAMMTLMKLIVWTFGMQQNCSWQPAFRVVSVPASSALVESVFSLKLKQFRLNLSDKMLTSIIFLKNQY